MRTFITIIFIALLGLAGCSDDESSSDATSNGTTATTGGTTGTSNGTTATSNGTTATTGGTTATSNGTTATSNGTTGAEETLITAANGGEVMAEGATLAIPAGALAEDTTITVTLEEPAEGAVSSVYDFGPDGLQFQSAATLIIDAGAQLPAEGETFVLAVWEDEAWAPLPSMYDEGTGVVAGEVEHFSRFAIIGVPGGVVFDSECSDIIDNFSACGGDLLGTWSVTDFCQADDMSGEFSFDACPGATGVAEVNYLGTATFGATEVTTSEVTLETMLTTTFPIGPDCQGGITCAEWETEVNQDPEDGPFGDTITCTDDAGVCTCVSMKSQVVQPATTVAYTTSGTNLSLGGVTYPYCISDDQFVLWLEGQDPAAAFVYARQ